LIKCSVCIPTYHRPDNLNMLLASILAMEDNRIAEVIVVITGVREESTNATTEQLERAYALAKVPLIMCSGASGICDAKEWMKDFAKEEVMLICDDDALFRRSYLDMLKYFLNDKVGAVSGSLQTPINVAGYKQWSDDSIVLPKSTEWCNTLSVGKDGSMDWSDKYQVYMIKPNHSIRLLKCEFLVGTCLMVRKEFLNIDMNFQQGACAGEEIDFTYAMYKDGKLVLFDTARMAFHLHSMVGGNRNKDRSQDDKNMTYLVQKWGLGENVKGETVYG